MRLLKYGCLFGGRRYPLYLSCAVAVIVLIASVQAGFSMQTATAAVLFASAAALLICWLLTNLPSDEERTLIAEAAPPVWDTAPESLRRKVAERAKLPSRNIIIAAVVCGIAAIVFLNLFKEDEGNALPVCAFLAGAGILLADLLYRMRFRRILDDSALCAVIPVDRTYDIESKSRLSRRFFRENNLITHYTSYLVFYLPDGRYTLPIPATDGRFNAVAVVRCRGMLRWTPVYQDEAGIKPV